jgi:hypothetical protein
MALPTSGPLSLSDIAGELESSTPYSLRDMSDFAGFGTPDAMSDFYGYDAGGGGPALTQFWITDPYSGNPYSICSISCEIPAWHTGLMAWPGIGDTVYTDSAGTTPLTVGLYGFYDAQYGPAKTIMELSKADNGAILNLYTC